MLLATGTTLNVQSFMGAIMAIGVAVANAILLVTFAEEARRHGGSPLHTAIHAARARMRPVLMTSAAMIAGMIPMALAVGEGAEATAPLGRAVIGGLLAATFTTLFLVPLGYIWLRRRMPRKHELDLVFAAEAGEEAHGVPVAPSRHPAPAGGA